MACEWLQAQGAGHSVITGEVFLPLRVKVFILGKIS